MAPRTHLGAMNVSESFAGPVSGRNREAIWSLASIVVLLAMLAVVLVAAWTVVDAAFYPLGSQFEFVATGMVLAVVGLALHVAGHALVALSFGEKVRSFRLRIIVFKLDMAGESPRTNYQQLLVTAAGPAFVFGFGSILSLVAAFGPGSWWSVWGLVAVYCWLEALFTLLVPLVGFPSDASRFYKAAWRTLLGRGDEPFVVTASGAPASH